MHWVLLHLIEDVALEDVAEEAVMSFLQAIEVVHEYKIIGLENRYFAQG